MNHLKQLSSIRVALVVAGALAMSAVSSRAQNSLNATATLSAAGSGTFDYTLTLQNTGSVDINSLWYGWIFGVFNLPVPGNQLLNVQNSLSWNAVDDGNSIQFENSGGSALTAGSSMTFTFSSTAMPASFITDSSERPVQSIAYASATGPSTFGQSQNGVASDPIATTLAVPEPSPIALLSVGGLGLAFFARKRKFAVKEIAKI